MVNVCEIVAPELALAPVMEPVLVPRVQAYELATEDDNVILGLPPLHTDAVVVFEMAGVGFTVTVIVVGDPTQLPVVEVGVTTYSIEPATALLGLDNVCEIVAPELALAPVMEPVFVPSVQAYELAAEDDKEMFGFPTLHTDAVVAVVTDGIGFTVTVIVVGEPTQLPVVEVGVTTY